MLLHCVCRRDTRARSYSARLSLQAQVITVNIVSHRLPNEAYYYSNPGVNLSIFYIYWISMQLLTPAILNLSFCENIEYSEKL